MFLYVILKVSYQSQALDTNSIYVIIGLYIQFVLYKDYSLCSIYRPIIMYIEFVSSACDISQMSNTRIKNQRNFCIALVFQTPKYIVSSSICESGR